MASKLHSLQALSGPFLMALPYLVLNNLWCHVVRRPTPVR